MKKSAMLISCQKVRRRCVILLVLGTFLLFITVGRLTRTNGALQSVLFTVSQDKDYQVQADQKDIPKSLKGLISSLRDLEGRHSDFITQSVCEDPEKKYQWNTSAAYDFIGPFDYLPNYKNPCFLDKEGNLTCVPYFYLIGAPKAGSTDIFHRITNHTQAISGLEKEIRWFDRRRFGEALTDPKYATFKGYLDFFAQATVAVNSSFTTINGKNYYNKVIGDGGPTYYYSSYYWKQVPGNEGCSEPRVTAISHIHHLWPHAKLVLVLRNPVTRLFSSYLFNAPMSKANRTPEQFHEWTLQSMGVWNKYRSQHSFRYCMYEGMVDWTSKLFELHIGQYSRYILDILKIFPRNQLMVVHLEDYSVNTQVWMRNIFSFLELEPVTDDHLDVISNLKAENSNYDVRNNTKPMLRITRKLLEDFYAPFNQELADIMNDKRFLWKTR